MKFRRRKTVKSLLANTLPEDKEIIQKVKKEADRNFVSNYLFIVRTANNVSQAEMAKRLGTTQSAISKMENRGDTITFNDVMRYLGALDCKVDMGILQDGGIQDLLNYHVRRINNILTELSALAGDDPDINVGALETFKKVLETIADGFMSSFATNLEKLAKNGVKLPLQINIASCQPKVNAKHVDAVIHQRKRSHSQKRKTPIVAH